MNTAGRVNTILNTSNRPEIVHAPLLAGRLSAPDGGVHMLTRLRRPSQAVVP